MTFPQPRRGVLEELASLLYGFIAQAHDHCTDLTPVLSVRCRNQGSLPGLGRGL